MTTVRENDGTSLCFLFSRADIDEVETEVVEIEAKLDKVRLVLLCQLPLYSMVAPVGLSASATLCIVEIEISE